MLELLREAARPLTLRFGIATSSPSGARPGVRSRMWAGSGGTALSPPTTSPLSAGATTENTATTPGSAFSSRNGARGAAPALENWEVPGVLNPRLAGTDRRFQSLLQHMNAALVTFQHEVKRTPPRSGSISAEVDRHRFLEWAAERVEGTQIVRQHYSWVVAEADAAGDDDLPRGKGIRFGIENHEFCIENDGLRIENDGFCISNDEFRKASLT